jgi:hypothetical protein
MKAILLAVFLVLSIISNSKTNAEFTSSVCDEIRGASVVATDGTFLGIIESEHHPRSLLNEYGAYGSKYSTKSIWNE